MGDQFIEKARILVTSKKSRSIIGREWQSTLRYKFEPVIEGKSEVNSIENRCEETKKFASELTKLFTRNGKVKNHRVRINLKENAKIVQQKGTRIPIQLQNAVDAEIKKLLKEGHIEKINEIKDYVFIQPTVITVKKDRSVKLAFDARVLNQEIEKDKYQKPNSENMLDMVAEKLDSKDGEAW